MPDCAGRRIVFRPNADYEMAADSAVALLFRPGDGVRHGFPGRHHANPAGMDFFGLFVLPLPTVCFVAVPARCRSTAASAVGVVSPAVSVSWLGQSVSVLGACSAGRFSAGWDCRNSSEKTGHLPALGCGCLPFAFCTFSHFRGTADAAFLSGASPLCRRRIAGRVAARWKNRWTKCAVAALIAVVLLNVTIEIHGFFSGNYSLRTSEYRILDRVAADLQRDYPLAEKPVLFVGSPNARYYVLDPGLLITQDRLGYSTASALLGIEGSPISVAQSPAIKLIPWAGQAFPGIYGVNGCLPQIFAQQGCPVLRGTAAQYAAAKEIAETMPEYPKAGYIKEMETFIIVHFGEG